jgi:hypothetical protein
MKTLSFTICLLAASFAFAQQPGYKLVALNKTITTPDKKIIKKREVSMRIERVKAPLLDREKMSRTAEISSASAVTTEIKAFPNPFTSQVDIFITDAHMDKASYKAEIFDVQGRKVHSEDLFLNQSSLQLSHLSKGVYILYIEKNGKHIKQEKLVKE